MGRRLFQPTTHERTRISLTSQTPGRTLYNRAAFARTRARREPPTRDPARVSGNSTRSSSSASQTSPGTEDRQATHQDWSGQSAQMTRIRLPDDVAEALSLNGPYMEWVDSHNDENNNQPVRGYAIRHLNQHEASWEPSTSERNVNGQQPDLATMDIEQNLALRRRMLEHLQAGLSRIQSSRQNSAEATSIAIDRMSDQLAIAAESQRSHQRLADAYSIEAHQLIGVSGGITFDHRESEARPGHNITLCSCEACNRDLRSRSHRYEYALLMLDQGALAPTDSIRHYEPLTVRRIQQFRDIRRPQNRFQEERRPELEWLMNSLVDDLIFGGAHVVPSDTAGIPDEMWSNGRESFGELQRRLHWIEDNHRNNPHLGWRLYTEMFRAEENGRNSPTPGSNPSHASAPLPEDIAMDGVDSVEVIEGVSFSPQNGSEADPQNPTSPFPDSWWRPGSRGQTVPPPPSPPPPRQQPSTPTFTAVSQPSQEPPTGISPPFNPLFAHRPPTGGQSQPHAIIPDMHPSAPSTMTISAPLYSPRSFSPRPVGSEPRSQAVINTDIRHPSAPSNRAISAPLRNLRPSTPRPAGSASRPTDTSTLNTRRVPILSSTLQSTIRDYTLRLLHWCNSLVRHHLLSYPSHSIVHTYLISSQSLLDLSRRRLALPITTSALQRCSEVQNFIDFLRFIRKEESAPIIDDQDAEGLREANALMEVMHWEESMHEAEKRVWRRLVRLHTKKDKEIDGAMGMVGLR